jgi:hypothetical protein
MTVTVGADLPLSLSFTPKAGKDTAKHKNSGANVKNLFINIPILRLMRGFRQSIPSVISLLLKTTQKFEKCLMEKSVCPQKTVILNSGDSGTVRC